MPTQLTISQAFGSNQVKKKFEELLGKRSQQFITSVLASVNNNKLLQNASWETIYQASITAATLDLPINQNLGFAYIVPYKSDAQFQLGYKGFIQLAQRTGLYKTINVSDVRQGEIQNFDRLTGRIEFDWIQDDSRLSAPVVGYVAYIELLNGFSKLFYMTKAELENHGKTYSQSFKKGFGLWKDDFDSMAKKTVLKLLLSKYAPLSTQMQMALESDQSVIKEKIEYPDNEVVVETKSENLIKRAEKIINSAESIEDLEPIQEFVDSCDDENLKNLFIQKLNTFENEPIQSQVLVNSQNNDGAKNQS